MKTAKNLKEPVIVLLLLFAAALFSGCIGEEPESFDKNEIQIEIQFVLDEQCAAIKNKDIDALMGTFSQNLSENYDKMKTGWEMAFSDVNVTGCEMIIKNLEISDGIAAVELRGTMTSVSLSAGISKTENFTENNRFVKTGNEWKQVY